MGPDEVIVTLERIYEWSGSARRFSVYDDDNLIGQIGAGSELTWKRSAGPMRLHVKAPALYFSVSEPTTVMLKKQKHYTFQVNSQCSLTLDERFPDRNRFDFSVVKTGVLRDQSNCIFGDCVSGKGTYIFEDNGRYSGDWFNGMMHGIGELVYADSGNVRSYKMVGGWKNDNPNVFFYFVSDSGTFVGEVENNERYGQGISIEPDGSIESGRWEDKRLVQKEPIEDVIKYLKTKYADYEWPSDIEELNPGNVVVHSSINISSGAIAIVDFEGNGIASSEARALTDRLRTELLGTSQFKIIERGNMEEILQEQAFQQSGCVSSECAVEVGKLLSVENIIIGSISRVGSINSVTARVVSVETGEIIRTAVYDHTGDLGSLLTEGMKKVAQKLGE